MVSVNSYQTVQESGQTTTRIEYENKSNKSSKENQKTDRRKDAGTWVLSPFIPTQQELIDHVLQYTVQHTFILTQQKLI
jgi:hypothetical protein